MSSRKRGPHLSSTVMQRSDGRAPDEIRPINFELNVAPHASGSVFVSMGNTRVICAVTIEDVPALDERTGSVRRMAHCGYSMLPVLDSAAQTSRCYKRPHRWSQRRNSTFDWPVVARGNRLGETRAPHDLGGLRCVASRWRDAHDRDHRREPGAGRRLPKIG